jgi:uncharacterized protein (TIGR02597 family)
VGLVLLNDPTFQGVHLAAASAYFYHAGPDLPAGWYNNDGSFELADNVLVSPEASIVINNSTATVSKVVTVGSVPVVKQANTIVSRVAGDQDNLVYNPYPAAITLGASNLASSGAIRPSSDITSPGDLLFVYSATTSGFNPGAASAYFYHAGPDLPAGWYNNDGSFEAADSVSLPPGVAIVVRKAAGSSTAVEWAPATPYSL